MKIKLEVNLPKEKENGDMQGHAGKLISLKAHRLNFNFNIGQIIKP